MQGDCMKFPNLQMFQDKLSVSTDRFSWLHQSDWHSSQMENFAALRLRVAEHKPFIETRRFRKKPVRGAPTIGPEEYWLLVNLQERRAFGFAIHQFIESPFDQGWFHFYLLDHGWS